MSLGYPPLRPKESEGQVENRHDSYNGSQELKCQRSSEPCISDHPLAFSEQHWKENQDKMDFVMLRNIQGIHAPLRLQMERKQAKHSLRLPGIHSSDLMFQNLSGQLDTIEYADILNNGVDAEVAGDTHALMERKLGLL